jgi:hypothetical protein
MPVYPCIMIGYMLIYPIKQTHLLCSVCQGYPGKSTRYTRMLAQANCQGNPVPGKRPSSWHRVHWQLAWDATYGLPGSPRHPVPGKPRRPTFIVSLKFWLARSASHPLYISLHDHSTGIHPKLGEVLELVKPHAHRFSTLDLESNLVITQLVLDAYALFDSSPSNLRMLEPKCRCLGAYAGMLQPLKPQIESFVRPVRILYLNPQPISNWTSESFHNLVDLSICSTEKRDLPSYEQLAQILRVCTSPRLHFLSLWNIDIHSPPQHSISPLMLKQLEYLSLRWLPVHFTSWLLGGFLPRLDGLSLHIHHRGSVPEQEIGTDFYYLVLESIKVLNLNYPAQHHSDFCRLILRLPNLENLTPRDSDRPYVARS